MFLSRVSCLDQAWEQLGEFQQFQSKAAKSKQPLLYQTLRPQKEVRIVSTTWESQKCLCLWEAPISTVLSFQPLFCVDETVALTVVGQPWPGTAVVNDQLEWWNPLIQNDPLIRVLQMALKTLKVAHVHNPF